MIKTATPKRKSVLDITTNGDEAEIILKSVSLKRVGQPTKETEKQLAFHSRPNFF